MYLWSSESVLSPGISGNAQRAGTALVFPQEGYDLVGGAGEDGDLASAEIDWCYNEARMAIGVGRSASLTLDGMERVRGMKRMVMVVETEDVVTVLMLRDRDGGDDVTGGGGEITH